MRQRIHRCRWRTYACVAGGLLIMTGAGAERKPDLSGKAPRGAIILFNGGDLSAWQPAGSGRPAEWTVANGELMVTQGKGNILTRQKFGDYQLHLEFNVPNLPDAHSQAKGNSGVYQQGQYEIQILDSFNNETYANGMCGAIYLQKAPDINASKPAGEWQSYDIWFRAPRFGPDGKQSERPRITVYHNGNLIHNNIEITIGATTASLGGPPVPEGPLMLQDHGNPVRYRNIWLKPIKNMKMETVKQ